MAHNPSKGSLAEFRKLIIDLLKLFTGKERGLLAVLCLSFFVLVIVFFAASAGMQWIFVGLIALVVLIVVGVMIYRWAIGYDLSPKERKIAFKMNKLERGVLGLPKGYISKPIKETQKDVLDLLEKLLL